MSHELCMPLTSILMTVNETNQPPVTVLLAEDDEINAQMIAEYMEAHNYEVFVSGDGKAVLQRARETSSRIILMDIQMPKMGGLEAIRPCEQTHASRPRRHCTHRPGHAWRSRALPPG